MGSPSHLARAAACAALLAAAGCRAGEVTVEAILPAGVSDDDLSRVRSFRLVATESGSGEVREASADAVGPLSVADLPDGRWSFRLEASDEANRVLLQASAGPVPVTRQGETTVRALLAPVEAFARLPIEGADADAIARLEGLSATTVADGAGGAQVLIAGGDDGAGPSRRAWLYDPALLRFEPVADLRCPRAWHAATAITRVDGRRAVLIAGGGDAHCAATSASATSASRLELFDPERRTFELIEAGWNEPPDLSDARLAPAGVGRAVLAAGAETWVITVDAGGRAREIGAWETPGAGRAAALSPSGLAAVVTGGKVFLLNAMGNACLATGSPTTFEDVDTATGLTRDDLLLVTGGDRWEMLSVSGTCTVAEETFEGRLGSDGAGRAAVALGDGRVLLVGGESGRTDLILPPCSRTTTPLRRPGPEAGHAGRGLAAAVLPDGAALIVGGGEDAEIFNPWRWGWKLSPDDTCEWPEQTEVFDADPRPDEHGRFRLLVVADASPAAAELRSDVGRLVESMLPGAWVEPEGRPDHDWDAWAGVLAAFGPLTRFEPETGCAAVDRPDWIVDSERDEVIYLANSDGKIETRMAMELGDRVEIPEDHPGACPVRQPLAAVQTLVAQLGVPWGDLSDPLHDDGVIPPGSILVVVIAAGDDCSNDPEYEGSERVPFVDGACAEVTEGMLDPEQVALEMNEAAESLDVSGISLAVAVVHRDPRGDDCELPPRLAAFVTALGPRGHAVAACDEVPLDDEISRLSNVASFLAYRATCNPFEGASEVGRCALELRWRDADGADRLATPGVLRFEADAQGCDGGAALRISPTFAGGDDVEGFDATRFVQFQALCW